MDMFGGDFLGQDHQPQSLGQASLEQALDAAVNVENFLYQRDSAVGPAKNDDVVGYGDRCQTLLQLDHHGNQPTGHDGYQRAKKYHVAAQGQHGGDDASPGALIIAEVARIGQAKKGPPDRVGQIALTTAGVHQPAADQRDQGDKGGDYQQLIMGALDELALDQITQPVDKGEWQHGVWVSLAIS